MLRLPGLLIVCVSFQAAKAEVTSTWIFDAAVNTVYEDNVSRSRFERDHQDDFSIRPFVAVGRHYQLANTVGLVGTVNLERAEFLDFSRMSHTTVTGRVTMKKKFGMGLNAPWMSAFVEGGIDDSEESARDAKLIAVGADVGRRFGDRANVAVGYSYDQRRAENNDVFDTEGQTVHVRGHYAIVPKVTALLGYRIRPGEIVTHTSGLNGAGIILNTFDRPMRAFNTGVKAHIIRGGLSWAIAERTSLNFSYEYLIAQRFGFEYTNNRYDLSLNFAF